MIIIENVDRGNDEQVILKAIGKGHFRFFEKSILEDCLYPNDDSISIGYYRNHIIICDNHMVNSKILNEATNLTLTEEEGNLCALFPNSEIVSVACHSVVNYHGYSLIKKSEKVRLKTISADTVRLEFGDRIVEEQDIYSTSYLKNGANFWKNNEYPDDEYTEDQMMEEFVFSMINRRLGVNFESYEESKELMEKTPFRKYKKPKFNFLRRIFKR